MTIHTFPSYPARSVDTLIYLLMQKGLILWLDLISEPIVAYNEEPQLELKTVPCWRVLKTGTVVHGPGDTMHRLTTGARVFVGKKGQDSGRFSCFATEENDIGENFVFWVHAIKV